MRTGLSFCTTLLLWLLACAPATAQNIYDVQNGGLMRATRLTGLSFDGLNSNVVRAAAQDGLELSGGEMLGLNTWYTPAFPNISASFETQLARGVSVLWGGSIGESGPKYSLGPSGMIGLAVRRPVALRGMLSLEVMGTLGGALRERSCVGDYGALGGVQPVNCRLAASTLPPKETLSYLWNEPPAAYASVRLAYIFQF
jgi:hypothetical protein